MDIKTRPNESQPTSGSPIDTPSTENSNNGAPEKATDAFPSLATIVAVLLMGIYFGIVLTKSEVVRWQRVHDMFLFNEAYMYLVIGSGIVVAALLMLLIKAGKVKSVKGEQIKYDPKPFHTGVIIGGVIFGAGWAITGACPGPIYAQIGGGAWPAIFTLVGALCGMFIYAVAKPKLPH